MNFDRNKTIEILAVENALVDMLLHVSDAEIEILGLNKGVMKLVDKDEQQRLLGSIASKSPKVEIGGSAANVLRGAAALGAHTAYSSSLGDDEWGAKFRTRLESLGIADRTVTKKGHPSGSCAVFITPDAERTMNTHLGACREYSPSDLPVRDFSDCMIFFTTGYMWDTSNQIAAVEEAVKLAKSSGAVFALDVADPFAVSRSGKRFMELADAGMIDIIFANAEEAKMLTGSTGGEAAGILAAKIPVAVVKDGARGSYVACDGKVSYIPVYPVLAVDTTGAGDMFAGGFLFGITKALSFEDCARIGSILASDNISSVGVSLSPDIRRIVVNHLPHLNHILT